MAMERQLVAVGIPYAEADEPFMLDVGGQRGVFGRPTG